ncbi:NADP-dependent 3-hydroxy acid dehydrogenase YdfG [Stigmatella aurantiaca]|uniref:NADP-dependent 3-hydroxy acid dehydrogenase YdfG n=1 Tax=Stigmatella aurantiaca TaxID=41 RepID=A0A1H7G6M3_STIAU|nr:SDR family oxidoreductase [Stigmatella aurantiaca]SEK32120.1 NADP-dependent 3-hydroxy acid dehydrogenase YdfG [Stigmatella aurantiaca]
MDIQGKVIAITGASSGIGEVTARLLAGQGARVVIGARRTDRLEALAAELGQKGREVALRRLDVTQREDVRGFVEFATGRFGRLDVLINNAGLMPLSRMDQLKVDEWDRMVDVNLKGVLYGIAAALPVFQAQKAGHFINVTSVADRVVVPTAAVYSGTKFAVRAISEGLRQEVGRDIRVTLVAPGATQSELPNTISDPELRRLAIEQYRQELIPAEAIARAIAFAIGQPADVDVNELVVRPVAQSY